MSVLGPDYERIAMCAHPEGTHEHVPLKPGEDPPESCFADCDCEPVVFVRADIHRGAVEALKEIKRVAAIEAPPVSDEVPAKVWKIAFGALNALGGSR
jgi:hypothetical protein